MLLNINTLIITTIPQIACALQIHEIIIIYSPEVYFISDNIEELYVIVWLSSK